MEGDLQVSGAVASRVFQKHFDGLAESLTHHIAIVTSKCHSEFFLSQPDVLDALSIGVSDQEKIMRLLTKVQTQIKLDFHKFHVFLKVLTEVLQVDTLSQRMEEDFKKLKEQAEESGQLPEWYNQQDSNPHDEHRYYVANSFHSHCCNGSCQASQKSSDEKKNSTTKHPALTPRRKARSLEMQRNAVAMNHQSISVPDELLSPSQDLPVVMLTPKDELAVKNAISKVNYWFGLGEHLGMEFHVLEEIRMDEVKFGLGHQRSTMVHKWLSSDLKASWNKLCDALDAIEERAAAEDIREKHILPSAPNSSTEATALAQTQEDRVKETPYDTASERENTPCNSVSRPPTGDSTQTSSTPPPPCTSTPTDRKLSTQESVGSGYGTGSSKKSSFDLSSGYCSQNSCMVEETSECAFTINENHSNGEDTINTNGVSLGQTEVADPPPNSDITRSGNDATFANATQQPQRKFEEKSLHSFEGHTSIESHNAHSKVNTLEKEFQAVSETSPQASSLVVSPPAYHAKFSWPIEDPCEEQKRLKQLKMAMDSALGQYEAGRRSDQQQRVSELEAKASEMKSFYEAKFKKLEGKHRLEMEQVRAQHEAEMEGRRRFHGFELEQVQKTHDLEFQYLRHSKEEEFKDMMEIAKQHGRIMRNQRRELEDAHERIAHLEAALREKELLESLHNGDQSVVIREECDGASSQDVNPMLRYMQHIVDVCNNIRGLSKQFNNNQQNHDQIKSKIWKLYSDFFERLQVEA